jgi:hypothetical protein
MTEEQTERLLVSIEKLAEGIAALTATMTATLVPGELSETTEEPASCEHPEEYRVSLATSGRLDRFYCKVCEQYIN